MSLANSILESLEGFSLAKYSTWFLYRPDRTLFDCGEGVSTTLGNRIYGVEQIFLSHGHGDHVAGIPGFLYSRASSMGDTEKPLDIYYPEGDVHIEKLRRYIQQVLPRPPYRLRWLPLGPDTHVDLSADKRHVQTFATQHVSRGISLGYRIVESRTRLREEYAGLEQKDLVGIIRRDGRDAITEHYEKNLLVYSGDSMPIPIECTRDSEVLLHEATFLDEAEREQNIHSTVGEAMEVAAEAGVRALLIFHLSTRYSRKKVKEAIHKASARVGGEFAVYYTFPRGLPTNFVQIR